MGAGGGMGICTPTSNPYIFVWVWWLKGQPGYPGFCMSSTDNYQTSQNHAGKPDIGISEVARFRR